MSAALLRFALMVATLGVFPAGAYAQLKDAQDRGWGMIKEGYSLVSSMKDNKSNRTKGNYDNALKVLRTGMAEMKPYLEKIGEKATAEDRSWAAGLKDETLRRWNEVAEAHQKLVEAVEKAHVAEELAEFTPELEKLKAALEQYETTCKAAYDNSKSHWEELKATSEKLDGEFKKAEEKVNDVEKQIESLLKDELSQYSDLSKIAGDSEKIAQGAWDVFVKRKEIEAKMKTVDKGSEDFKRLDAEREKTYDVALKILEVRRAMYDREKDLKNKLEREMQDNERLEKDSKAAGEQMSKAASGATQRFRAWDEEFPAQRYSFQSLR